MRKLVILVCLLVSGCLLFAQNTFSSGNSSNDANRNTAIRCLKLSENYFMGNDWKNALKQAELGLAYDDNISDLLFLKSAAEVKLNKPKADIIKTVESAFSKNDWVGYTKTGARILYADLLSDTKRYNESMAVLDDDPLLFSADAEFIRIKNLYRIGTKKSIRDARDKVSVASRIYPKDDRFPNIFFMFELMFMDEAERNGKTYKVPASVQNIANVYIKKLPDYKGDNKSIELMASFFVEDEDEKVRLVKAIDAKESHKNTLLAYAGLKTGLYSEQQAFDMFFSAADNYIHLGLLENFALSIAEEGVKNSFVEKLLNYDGLILIDNDFDLQPEIKVEYKVGRPHLVSYDPNNDDEVDMSITCNFGVPGAVHFIENKANLYYSTYPNVENVSYDGKDFVLNFYDDDYKVEPVKFVSNKVLGEFGFDLFVPEILEFELPDINQLKLKASAVALPTTERKNSKVVYTTLKGQPVFADFYEDGKKYGFCDLSKGFPFNRDVDQDNDGIFETVETYNIAEKVEDYITKEEIAFVESVFNPIVFDKNVYLMEIKIDRNSNTHFEFTEKYLGLDGKITTWDNDDNGYADSRYIKYPKIPGEELKEESIFFDEGGEPYITIKFLGGVPVKMDYKKSEVLVFAGSSDNFYWVDKEGTSETEKIIMETVVPKLSNGVIKMVQIEEIRVSVIKINDKIFCKIIPLTRVGLED